MPLCYYLFKKKTENNKKKGGTVNQVNKGIKQYNKKGTEELYTQGDVVECRNSSY